LKWAVVGIAACVTRYLAVHRAIAETGPQDHARFERREDREQYELPSEDERDAAIVKRPARGMHG
jgi:hypothetical protein